MCITSRKKANFISPSVNTQCMLYLSRGLILSIPKWELNCLVLNYDRTKLCIDQSYIVIDTPKHTCVRKASYATATRLIPKRRRSLRDSYKADPEKKKASVRDSYKTDPEKKASVRIRDSYNADIEYKQSAKRQRYQEDLEESRAAKRQLAISRTIQLPLRHLKGIGIRMNPLFHWLNVLPRGRGIAGVIELLLPPKGMSWHVVLH